MPEENGTRDEALEAQRDARAAVTAIPLFPELERRLVRTLGPTAEAILLHQLVYWFGKKSMQDRWTLYKTAEEWRAERGLSRKQVDRARKRLAPTGLVEETKGLHKRVHYRVDWVRLRDVLEGERLYPLKGEQSETVPPKGGSDCSVPPKGGALTTVPPLGDAGYYVPPSSGCEDEGSPHGNGRNGFSGGPNGGYEPIQETTQETTPGENDGDYFQEKTPPSSSSLEPVGSTNPGGSRNSPDDDKNRPSSISSERAEEEPSANGGRPSRAARESAQTLAAEIEALPEEKDFYASLAEGDPEMAVALDVLRGVEGWPSGLEKDKKTVAKLREFRDQWPGVDPPELCRNFSAWHAHCGVPKNARPLGRLRTWFANDERYGGKSARNRGGRTLGGVGRRHDFEAVENVHARNTEDFFEEL